MVEIAAVVQRHRGFAAGLGVEQEELDLGVGVEGEPHVGGLVHRPLQHPAWVSEAGRAIGLGDVAEHAGRAADLLAPGQQLEGTGVRPCHHVGLVDAGITLDRRPVEAHPFAEGSLDLGRGNRHRLERAEHIGEPQSHEADVALFH